MTEKLDDNEFALMANQILTENSQARLTKKLIELIRSEYSNLLSDELQKAFQNVLVWFDSEEQEIYNNFSNWREK